MKKLWIYLIAGVLALALLAGAGLAGALYYSERKAQANLAAGNRLFQEGKWFEATRRYGLYLQKKAHRGDVHTLFRYAEASSNIKNNRRKSLRDAIVAYAQILRYQPNNTKAENKLLDTLEHLQNWPDLEYYSGDILRRSPDDVKAQLAHARALDGMQRSDEAIAAYRALIKKGIADASVYAGAARLLRGRGLPQQALQIWSEAEKKRPDDPQVYLEKAKYLRAAGDMSTSDAALAKALKLAPDNTDVLLEEAEHAVLRREWSRAQAAAEKALAHGRDNPRAYIAMSVVDQGLNQIDKAISVLKSAPPPVLLDSQRLYFTLIETLITGNRLDEARKALAQYKKSYPDSEHVIDYFRSRLLLVTGDATGAATRLTTLVQQHPDFSPARFLLGVAYLRSGHPEKGRAVLEAYLKMYPGDARAKALLEMESGQRQTPEEAQKQARALIANVAAQPEDLVTAARMLFDASMRQGDPKASLDLVKQALEKAIAKAPTFALSYKTLADVLVAVHDPQGASAALERGIAAGVKADRFYLNRAAIALAQGHLDQVKAEFAKVLGEKHVTVDTIQTWANFMAARNHMDIAADILTQGAAKVQGDERATLLANKAGMLARAGDTKDAQQLLSKLESNPAQAQAVAPQLAAAKLLVAQRLLEQNKPALQDTARGLVEAVANAEPGNAEALTLQALLLLRRQPPSLDRAQSLLEKAIATDGSDVNALLWLAEIAIRKKENDKALGYVKRVAAVAPWQPTAELRLAQLQNTLKQYDDAQWTLQRLLERNPDSVDAMRLLMASYLESGRVAKAETLFPRLEEKASADSKLAAQIKTLRARLLVAKGEGKDAEGLLRAQLEKDPDNLTVLRTLAQAIDQQGRTQEAEKLLTSYTAKHSDNIQGWLTLAEFYLTRKDDTKLGAANQALTRALLIDPKNPAALRDMITVDVRRHDSVEALALCNRYLSVHPNDADTLYLKASIESQNPSALSDALMTINRALAARHESNYVALRGVIFLALGEYKKALDDLQPLANSVRETPAPLDAALAETYLGLDNLKLARKYYKSAAQKAAAGARVDQKRMQRIEQALKEEKSTS